MSLEDELTEDEFRFIKHLIIKENVALNYLIRKPEEITVPSKRVQILESLSDKFGIENPDFLSDQTKQ